MKKEFYTKLLEEKLNEKNLKLKDVLFDKHAGLGKELTYDELIEDIIYNIEDDSIPIYSLDEYIDCVLYWDMFFENK